MMNISTEYASFINFGADVRAIYTVSLAFDDEYFRVKIHGGTL